MLDVFIFKHSASCGGSLHLVEHIREGRLELQGFLDFVRTHEGIFAIFQEARALMVTNELEERRGIRLPILGKALEIFENGIDTVAAKMATASSVYLSKSVSKMPCI